jgi:Uma2 family endonuclease
MNVIVRPGMSRADFLAWEREQPLKHEFDGTQQIPMNGVSIAHARLVRRIMEALYRLLPAGYEAFGGSLKVLTAPNRVRYPDVAVTQADPQADGDIVDPVVVFEVLSPSTMQTDLRVKPAEYATVASLLAYVILPQDTAAGAAVLRRTTGWAAEALAERLDLPEIGVAIPLRELYPN